MNLEIRPRPVKSQSLTVISGCRAKIGLLLLVACLLACRSAVAAPDPGSELENAVRQMNIWLAGDDQSEGWRRFLMLNVLDTQAAKGAQADLEMLSKVEARFASGAKGLNHPMFRRVHHAIGLQIEQLRGSQYTDILQQLNEARGNYHRISIEEMEAGRDRAVEELLRMRRYYRRTMSSRPRANLFYDLELDAMLETLAAVEMELPPEVSVGKIQSMKRDLQQKRRAIVEKIDALPTRPQPDDGQDPGDPTQDGPDEDKSKENRQDLERQRDSLTERIDALDKKEREVAAADLPRRRKRSQTFRELLRLEQNLIQASKTQGDPYFISAAATYEEFVRTYFYGTDDNLQEKYLNRLEQLSENYGELISANPRVAAGKLGDDLRWLENARQASSLVTAIRSKYSNPNAIVMVSSNLLSQVANQHINDTQLVRQNVGGRLVRGTAVTNASVSVDLVNDPNQVHASIHLFGNITTNTYIQQGKLQVFTQALGTIEARRSIYANVGGLFANQPYLAACFQADFLGTTSRLNLINRIAASKFADVRGKAEGQAARQAEEQLEEQFLEQTDGPIGDAQDRLGEALLKSSTDSNKIPSIYLRSTPDHILAFARKETISTISAPDRPSEFGVNPDISVRVHDSLLSNYLDKTFSGRTFTNDELAQEIADLFGEAPPSLTGEAADEEVSEPFSITFSQVRPIQFEFEDQGFSILVSGRRFSQGDKTINEPLNIILRFRVRRSGDKLMLVRNGPVDFSYPDPDRTTPRIVAFRSFLDRRLNKEVSDRESSQELPDNLLPIERVDALKDSEVARNLKLVQFRSEQGWLYIGWNYQAPGTYPSWVYDLPAIWNEYTIDRMEPSYTPQN